MIFYFVEKLAVTLSAAVLAIGVAIGPAAAAAKQGGGGQRDKCRAQAQQSDPGFNAQAAKRRAAVFRQCMQSGGKS
jgi:hypothetical protein